MDQPTACYNGHKLGKILRCKTVNSAFAQPAINEGSRRGMQRGIAVRSMDKDVCIQERRHRFLIFVDLFSAQRTGRFSFDSAQGIGRRCFGRRARSPRFMPEWMLTHAVVFLQAEDPTRFPIPRDNNKGLVPCCALTNFLGHAVWNLSLFRWHESDYKLIRLFFNETYALVLRSLSARGQEIDVAASLCRGAPRAAWLPEDGDTRLRQGCGAASSAVATSDSLLGINAEDTLSRSNTAQVKMRVGSLLQEKIAFAICEMASSVLDDIREPRMPSAQQELRVVESSS